MPSSRAKDLIKNFDLGKIFAVRLSRIAKNRRTQHSSTTTHHGGDHSVSADIPIFINISSATSSRVDASAHKASDMAQTYLPAVQAIAGAIPFAGPPMQATISGLLSILQVIDRRCQNRADLDRLASRLYRLSSHLCNAPTTQDPFEQFRRDSIIGMLQDISSQVTQLYNRGLAYTSVTQAIIGCSSKIDDYLADYSWSSQMYTQHDIHEVRKTLERHEQILMSFGSVLFPGQPSVGPIVTLGFVTLVDATSRLHSIPMDVCDSFERFNEQLQLLFKRNSPQAQIQRQYMEQGQYDLCIDDDKQVTRLTSHEWPSIEAGTKIVMRVVFEQQTSSRVDYHCHFCGVVNDVGIMSIMDSLQRQAGCSINCRNCKRRFQISRPHGRAKRSAQSSAPRTEAEMYIQNFHIQQTNVDSAASSSRLQSKPKPRREEWGYITGYYKYGYGQEWIPEITYKEGPRPEYKPEPKFREVNEAARDLSAGGASASSHMSKFRSDSPTISPQPNHFSPSHDEYGHKRIEEIEEDSSDDYGEQNGAEYSDDALSTDDEEWEDCDDEEDQEEWEDCDDGEAHEETNYCGEL